MLLAGDDLCTSVLCTRVHTVRFCFIVRCVCPDFAIEHRHVEASVTVKRGFARPPTVACHPSPVTRHPHPQVLTVGIMTLGMLALLPFRSANARLALDEASSPRG